MVYAKLKQVIKVEVNHRKVLLETRLRNLKRKYAKLSQYSRLVEEVLEIQKEIQSLESEIAALQ